MDYKPSPMDHSHIELGDELEKLVEMLARNNHELWAQRRMEEGWRYGPQRSDDMKETPVLVPYEELPDSEREYDRQNAVQTLKTIIALGGVVQAPK